MSMVMALWPICRCIPKKEPAGQGLFRRSAAWFFDPGSDVLMRVAPIVAKIMAVRGATATTKTVTMDQSRFEKVTRRKLPEDRVDATMRAFRIGIDMIGTQK